MERDGKVKIQPPHLIVLFCQEKPQMPVVKQRLDPFFGCELQGWGHCAESFAIGLLFKGPFSVLPLCGVQSLTSVKVSEDLLSVALSSSPPISYNSDYPRTPANCFSRPLHMPLSICILIFLWPMASQPFDSACLGLINTCADFLLQWSPTMCLCDTYPCSYISTLPNFTD